MDKKLAGLLGAVGALASVNAVQAAIPTTDPTEVLKARSYADLLSPVPNAMALLKAIDKKALGEKDAGARVAQYYEHHHHHHHHNSYHRRNDDDDRRTVIVPRYRDYRDDYRYRHHHHHHNNYYRRYRDDD